MCIRDRYETDANDIFYVRIDKNRKLPVTLFLKAMGRYDADKPYTWLTCLSDPVAGCVTSDQLKEVFANDERIVTTLDKAPVTSESASPVGRHLDGCRIGFDAGGSDRKVSAVIDGEAVFSEEVVWFPKTNADPKYHYDGILQAMKTAASHMPRVDGLGVSSAGVYVDCLLYTSRCV